MKRKFLLMLLILTMTAVFGQGTPPTIEPREPESPLRRGEIIFFISYPFTFLGSLVAYNLAGYAITAADGRNDFAGTGGGFYGLVAATAAIMSFGIATNDFYSIKAQARNSEGTTSGYLTLTLRF